MLPDLATLRPNAGITRALQYALAIFTLTALIGLANATKVFGTLDRATILAHVHSGTLGFITMGAFGLALWAFGSGSSESSRRNVLITALSIAAYILAFWSGNLPARAIFGTILLVLIYAWWWWVFGQVRTAGFSRLDNPRLAMFLGLTTLVIGSTIGVAIQILLATGQALPQGADLVGAHASAQVSGYLVLFGVGLGEWWLRADHGARSRGGVTQAFLLFLAGLSLSVGASLSIQPLLLLNNLLSLIALVIFISRVGGPVRRTAWGAAGAARHIAFGPIFLVINFILLVALVNQFIAAQGDFSRVSLGLLTALDHSMFIGVMTNVLFGAALAVTAARGGSGLVDHAVFWLMNVGLVGFLAVLVFAGYDSDLVKFTAPVMGVGVLLGIATLVTRLGATSEAPAASPMRA